MEKQLLNNKLYIITDEKEIITIKEIKECIKSLKILGIENIKIKGIIKIDYDDHNKHIKESDAVSFNNCIYKNECLNIEIINNNKVLYGNDNKFEVKINKDNSYDYEGKHYNYFLSPITKIELSW